MDAHLTTLTRLPPVAAAFGVWALCCPQAAAVEPAWPALPAVGRALGSLPANATLVAFAPDGANAVFLAQKLPASADRLQSELSNPAAYQQAIPSFVQADVVAKQMRGKVQDSQVAWELEIPLRNLEGTLWFKPFNQAMQIRVASGDFTPGQFLWQWNPLPAEKQVLLALHGTANTRDANFATRRIAARSPAAEPAMTVAAAYTLMEAMVDKALANAHPHPLRWPQAAMRPPSATTLQSQLGAVARELKFSGPLALVLRKPNGRLDQVQIAIWSPLPAGEAIKRVARHSAWRALPGWKHIQAGVVSDASASGGPADRVASRRQQWEVDASFPFLDFDATWDVVVGSDVRATAVQGPGQGAVWAWQATPAPTNAPGQSLLVFSVHLRLDKLGYLPRKFIEKEPLLEAGLTLALAYVDAVALAGSLPGLPADQP